MGKRKRCKISGLFHQPQMGARKFSLSWENLVAMESCAAAQALLLQPPGEDVSVRRGFPGT